MDRYDWLALALEIGRALCSIAFAAAAILGTAAILNGHI